MSATKYCNSETFDATAPLKVDSVRVKWIEDNDADLSYLEQDYEDCTAAQRAKYKAQDKGRLARFGDDWCMMGCRVEAETSRPIGQGSRRLQSFSSSGLWGIESDSDASYKAEIERDQFADLAEHLNAYGFNVTAEELMEAAK